MAVGVLKSSGSWILEFLGEYRHSLAEHGNVSFARAWAS